MAQKRTLFQALGTFVRFRTETLDEKEKNHLDPTTVPKRYSAKVVQIHWNRLGSLYLV